MIDIFISESPVNKGLIPFLEGKQEYKIQCYPWEKIAFYIKALHTDLIVLYHPQGSADLETLKNIKKQGTTSPIIYLLDETDQGIIPKALNAGADDCIRLPMSFLEFEARLKAILRRSYNRTREKIIEIDGCSLHPSKQHLEYNGKRIEVTTRESQLLDIFFRNPNIALKRSDILVECWGRCDRYASNALDTYISKLRKILSINPHIELLTVWGYGFKLTCD